MHRSASVPPVAMSPRWYALPASMAHHCGPMLGRTVQPRPTRRNSQSASPDLEDHRGDRRSGTHPWERRRPRRHDPPCLNRPSKQQESVHTTRQITAPHLPPWAGEGASVPRTSTHAQLAETAGQPRRTGNTIVEKAGQPRPIVNTIVEKAGQPRPIVNTIVEIAVQPRTPGSAGALAGMILSASTDPPNNRWHAHHPPDHRVPFASGDETACLTGLNCSPSLPSHGSGS